jgi:hypothetical protein
MIAQMHFACAFRRTVHFYGKLPVSTMARARFPKVCSQCGHPLADPDRYGLYPTQRRVFDVIARSGRAGVTRRDILALAWAEDPNGGPSTPTVVSVHVRAINLKIAPHGLVIVCDAWGSHTASYKLYRLKDTIPDARARLARLSTV